MSDIDDDFLRLTDLVADHIDAATKALENRDATIAELARRVQALELRFDSLQKGNNN